MLLVVKPAHEPDASVDELQGGDVAVPERAAARVEIARRDDLDRRVVVPALLGVPELDLRTELSEALRRRPVPASVPELGLELVQWPGEHGRPPADAEHGAVGVAGDGMRRRRCRGRQTRRTITRESHLKRSEPSVPW